MNPPISRKSSPPRFAPWLALLAATAWLAGCNSDTSAPPDPTASAMTLEHVGVNEADMLIQRDATLVVLDIRTPGEFEAGHIPGATNIDFRADTFETDLAQLDRGKSYLVHCASGGRSTQALAILQKLDFERVYHLDGGFNAWKAEGKAFEE